MEKHAYMVAVETPEYAEEGPSIASAAAYLAYGDRTDTFGYAPDIEKAICWETKEGTSIVDLTFEPMMAMGDDLAKKRFMDEMAQLSRVLTVEQVR
jgi:hypothetical protein